MMEIGTGSSAAIQKTIATMGPTSCWCCPHRASGGVSFGSGSVTTLTPLDGEAILRDSPSVRNVARWCAPGPRWFTATATGCHSR